MLLFINISTINALTACKFQYISCYSLSNKFLLSGLCNTVSIHLMLLFIETRKEQFEKMYSCFNTSHVTLYQQVEKYVFGIDLCFNTSHVTLYLLRDRPGPAPGAFQYISCYSLSIFFHKAKAKPMSFNTSHVTLYLMHKDK